MRLHDLKPAPGSRHRRKRVGRGNANKGKTSGRGQKGQKARNSVHPWFEGGQMPLQRRLPKWGGFTNRNRVEYSVVNVERLAEVFDAGAVVTPDELSSRGIVRRRSKVKVLAQGDIGKALTVRAHRFSKQAEEKIRSAGGTTEVI